MSDQETRSAASVDCEVELTALADAFGRLDDLRAQLAAEANLIERETRNGWPIEAATELRDAKDLIAGAQDLIEAALDA